MVVKMKKLTFLVYYKEYEAFLDEIRELGVVHVQEKQQGTPNEKLQQDMQLRSLYSQTLQSMYQLADKQLDDKVVPSADGMDLIKQYEALQERIKELSQQLPSIDKELSQLEDWGDFDWNSVHRLEQAGLVMQFFSCPKKQYAPEWEKDHHAIVVKEDKTNVFFVIIAPTVAPIALKPLDLPDKSLSELHRQKSEVETALAQTREQLKAFAKENYTTLHKQSTLLQGDIDLLKVKLNGEEMASGAVVLLEGWIPVDCETAVVRLLDESGVYYEIRSARREDNPPVKLRNNAFTRMYETLTKMYGMPSFTDFDPTPIVAPFFSLFFAFCMGDAGYGLILILLGFVLKKKMGKDMAGMMNLVITLGIFTTVIGALLGTFFGISLLGTGLPQSIKDFIIAGDMELLGSTYDKQMILALGIGVVHISIAMTVKAINSTVFYGFKESLSVWSWWLVIVGSVLIGTFTFLKVIPEDISQWALIAVGGIGAIGIYLLNNLRRNILINIGAGLWDTYNMASGLLGDILSYIRLFALGMAGGMLGQTFNNLALMVVDATEGTFAVLGWIGFGLIVLFGHTLNIAMSCLSAFVHPLRLTFVEYFKNAGYEGKGTEYVPFKKAVK